MKNPRLLTTLGILTVLVLLAVFFPRGDAGKDRESGTDAARTRPAATRADTGDSGSRADGPTSNRQRQPLDEHQPEDLARFILPLAEGREVTLKEAVRALMVAYKDTCHRTHAKPLELEFDLPGDATRRFSFSLEHATFDAALDHLAALAGFTVRADGLQVVFEPGGDDKESAARGFRARPGFQASLGAGLQRLGISHDGTLAGMASAAGLTNLGSGLSLGPGGPSLHGTQAELERLETWLACLPSLSQLKATVKLIHSESPLDIDPRSATPDEVRTWLDSLGNQTGVRMTAAPSIMVREAHQAKIDLIQGLPNDWTGKRITLDAERAGLAILAKDTTEYRPDDRSTPVVRDTNQGIYQPGEPQVSLVSRRDGDCLYRVLTLETIDATGRPMGIDGGHPVAAPVPGKQGFVISPHSGKIIDVRDIPSGTLVVDPAFPPEERKYLRVP